MLTLIFDNTPLSHFARAGQLAALESLVMGCRCIVPADVIDELRRGVPQYPSLHDAIALPWTERVVLDDVAELVAFAKYKSELGGGSRNTGEAAVLAWTRIHGGLAIIDDRAGAAVAARDSIDVQGTLWLITNAYRTQSLNRSEAESLADALLATDMRLPFTSGTQLWAWAYERRLLP